MPTRADFYVGRGRKAIWRGSIAFDGYPDNGQYARILASASEAAYRQSVAALLAYRDDATRPEDGWPWPWADSRTTDYAYAYDAGKVWVSRYGRAWYVPAEEDALATDKRERREEVRAARAKVKFPDMSSRRNVTVGKRSGLLIRG